MTNPEPEERTDPIEQINALVSLARSAREDDVENVLRTVVETIHSVAGFDAVVFNKYRPAWDDYEVVMVVGPPDTQLLMHTKESRQNFERQLLTSEYERQPGTYFVPGTASVWSDLGDYVIPERKRPSFLGGWEPEDGLFVQLRDSRGEPLGIVSVDEPRSGRIPDVNELRLLRAICSHAEQSLENVQVSVERDRHRERLTQLLGASAKFSQCETHLEVLETACAVLIPRLGFERAAIYCGQNDHSLTLAYATFSEEPVAVTLETSTLELLRDTTREVGGCWTTAARDIHGTSGDAPRSRRNGAGDLGWSDDILLAPIFDGEGWPRLVFAIEDPVTHLRPTEIERDLVRLLVEHTDAALERITFRNRLEHLVDHDASTGLLNRRALARIPHDESAVVMICDLDHFKSLNDTYGHEVGDTVICHFAELLQSLSREKDLAIRLGGDEFMVFLPATSVAHATTVAERLRVALPPLMSAVVPTEITVSIGLTPMTIGEHLVDAMRRADSALYTAKKNGRNQISVN